MDNQTYDRKLVEIEHEMAADPVMETKRLLDDLMDMLRVPGEDALLAARCIRSIGFFMSQLNAQLVRQGIAPVQ